MKVNDLNWKEHVMVFVLLIIGFVYVELQPRFIASIPMRFVGLFVVSVILSYIFFAVFKRKNVDQLGFFLGVYWAFLVILIVIFYDWAVLRLITYRQPILIAIVFVSPIISGKIYKLLNR
jgi:hypothetical protein